MMVGCERSQTTVRRDRDRLARLVLPTPGPSRSTRLQSRGSTGDEHRIGEWEMSGRDGLARLQSRGSTGE